MYAIDVYASNCSRPIGSLAWHSWVVITIDDVAYRYDILHDTLDGVQGFEPLWGHLHMNTSYPYQWMLRWWSIWKPWPAHLLYHKEFDKQEQQALGQLIDLITHYPHLDQYRFWWPNSNSFTQRVIDQCPLITFTLPPKAYGRSYYRKRHEKI